MAYNHDRQRVRVRFEDPDPLAGLTMVLWTASVDDYIRLGKIEDGEPTPERVETLCEAMGPMLVEWDLTQNGEPVPATTAGLRSLSVPLAVRLAGEWLSAVARVPAPLGQSSSDGEPSAEGSIPMEVLSPSPPS
jgi:hypothetical protein